MPVKGLTPAEVAAATQAVIDAGGKSTDRANRLPGETGTEANARITAAYKNQPKPELTQEGAAANAQIKFVRTEAGGVGTFKEIFPIGATIPTTRTTEFGNVYDTEGNLVSGSGLKPGVSGTATTVTKTPDQIAAYDGAKDVAQSFVDLYGGKLSDYFDATTGRVTRPTDATIIKKFTSAVTTNPSTSAVTTDPSTSAVTTNPSTSSVTIIPGSSSLSTVGTTGTAFDAFKNTLSLFFGPTEISKSWVSELYKTVSGFTKSGSTPEEAFNLALLESENNPAMTDFTKRFKGIFALQKMKQGGKAVTVPTVAEYFKTQSAMGDILKSSNLGSLANEDFLGDILGKGIAASQFAERIVNVFDRIDTASDVNKKTISRFFPTVDRTQLAKALLMGEKGAKQLEQELAGYEVLAGAEQQGLGVSPTMLGGVTTEQALQIAKGGGTYANTLGQFGQIAGARETEQKLAEISGVQSIGVTGLTSAVISKSSAELKKLEDLTRQEEARYSGKAGNIGSKTFASQSRANRLI